jgi:hypothetical protein
MYSIVKQDSSPFPLLIYLVYFGVLFKTRGFFELICESETDHYQGLVEERATSGHVISRLSVEWRRPLI